MSGRPGLTRDRPDQTRPDGPDPTASLGRLRGVLGTGPSRPAAATGYKTLSILVLPRVFGLT